MAVKFLDSITVEGARSTTITGGNVFLKGQSGGWAIGYFFTGSSGTDRGGFGALGSTDSLSYYYIGDAYNDTTMVVQPNAGSVGIGTTSPSGGDLTNSVPKLHVAATGTSGTFNLAARFQSTTTDANNTGTSILINSSNDRGLLIKAGRKDGDREVAYFDVVSSAGNTTNMLTMGKFDSDYNVGIGTTTPGANLDVISEARISYSPSNQYRVRITNSDGNGRILVDGDTSSLIFGTSGAGTGATATERIRINSAGNVGIGTTSPSQKLTVAGVIKIDTSSDKQMQFARTGGNTFSIEHDAARMYFYNETSANVPLTLLNNGDVGIGTTGPSDKLTVAGDIVTTAGFDGGMRIGGWPYNTSGYSFIGTTNMSGLEYCMLSDGTNTFLGAGTNGALKLRGPANDSSPEIIINGTIVEVNTGDLKVTDGSIAVGNITNSTTNGRIDASNDVVAFSTSDIRLKDNIKSIDKALDKVNSIQGIEFDWIEKEEVHGNSGHDIGVIAQEIEKILPDIVTTRDNGYKAVKYEKIVPLLIEAIKDLSKQVDGLKRLI